MLRYNHGLLERKWQGTWLQSQTLSFSDRICTVCIPGDQEELTMENARLLVLTDFLALVTLEKKLPISIVGASGNCLKGANQLGLLAQGAKPEGRYDLAVVPRDFAHGSTRIEAREVFFGGRLLQTESMWDLLPDFGVDAMRIYFLFLGPPARDYKFQWQGLASAYRFVTRFWELAQRSQDAKNTESFEPQSLLDLKGQVQTRNLQRKPHTALAAIMGYLKNRPVLTQGEIKAIAMLLQPFTPFLSAELLGAISPV